MERASGALETATPSPNWSAEVRWEFPSLQYLCSLASEIVLMGGIVLVFGPARNRLFNDLFRLQPRLTS